MSKLSVFFILLAFSIISCNRTTQNAPNGENTATLENAPQMEFEKNAYDFGELKEGDIVKYAFKFKNVGKSDLLISNVTVGCGCTVASKPEGPIKPNENNQIVVQFNTTGKAGPQRKQVTVFSNAVPDQKILMFTAVVLNDAKTTSKK
jgi:Protein of unknown function (DUF1573)